MGKIKYLTSIWSQILLVVLLTFNKAESNICEDNKPCQGRGGCFIIEEASQSSFLSTKCVCTRGYRGRWCQFVGKENNIDSFKNALRKLMQTLIFFMEVLHLFTVVLLQYFSFFSILPLPNVNLVKFWCVNSERILYN